MNIWLINHYAVPPQYYPLARTTCFAKYLMRAGHSVTIFAASTVHNSNLNLITGKEKYKEETVDGIHYVYIPTSSYTGNGKSRIINMFEFALRLPKVCGNFGKPDAVLASSATPPACMAGLKLARKYKCRAVAEITDLWPESFVAYGLMNKKNPLLKLMYLYEKRIYIKADAIVFSMEGGKDYIIEKGWDKAHGGPVDTDKVYHINNGVDLEQFNINRNKFTVDDELLTNHSTFKVVYAGSIRKVNNLSKLVEVAAIVNQTDQDIIFLIYGDGDERHELEEEARSRGLNNIYFKGKVDKQFIPFITSNADLNIIHIAKNDIMRYGCSFNKLFDSFASGKPVLSDVLMKYDLIKKYNAGVSLDTQSAQEIADEIERFKNMSRDEYRQYHDGAIRAAADSDFKNLTDKLIEILSSKADRK